MAGSIKVAGHEHIRHDIANDKLVYGTGVPAGTVLQLQYAEEKVVRDTTARYSDSQANFEAIHTDFKIEILPTLSTNYLLFSGSFSVGQSSSTYGVAFRWYISGGGSSGFVGDGDNSSYTNARKMNVGGPTPTGAHSVYNYHPQVRIRLSDSIPNWSAGILTVQPYWAVNAAGTGRLNQSGANTDHANYGVTQSSFFVYEIQG
ncbi:MAG: hypothetical protein CBC12_10720 [Candidatus Puniceispirillum sp. TMED52]|nr:MAG: hypothetical protein CBC12_10720 [Candidatus Puniceispirillum sp. TMED52]|tara:strand:+ start:876 stop:1484 length:609 start_codon:yes stop_codon:yes gene_type:complete